MEKNSSQMYMDMFNPRLSQNIKWTFRFTIKWVQAQEKKQFPLIDTLGALDHSTIQVS